MKYDIIYADPPWAYQNWTDKKNGAVKAHYPTLSAHDIAMLPVEQIASDNSVLFLWATWPKLKEALGTMESWGYTYLTAAFVWVKRYENGRNYCGLGFYTRSGTEMVLLGKRGKAPQRMDQGVRQLVESPEAIDDTVRRPHSSKPPIVASRIVDLFGDVPRIELFAREKAPGWDALGWEITGTDIRDDLRKMIDG